MPDPYDIDKKYGVPSKDISCPGCGLKYGHHNTGVCVNCEECSKCCRCSQKTIIKADEFIVNIVLEIL